MQLALDWPSQPSYLAGDFVVGTCNRSAHELLTRWPDWPHFAVGLYGPSGAGKTHLAHIWAAAAGAGIADLGQLREQGPQGLLSTGSRWVMELADAPDGLPDDDEASLFHWHNLIRQANGAVLYVSRLPLARWTVTLPDLRSRFAACPSIGVTAPDDTVLVAVMKKLAADRQIELSKPVVNFLLPRIERSFASVASIVHAIDVYALAKRRAITPALAGEVLKALAQETNQAGEDG